MPQHPIRRRSPMWVRELSQPALHSLAGRLRRTSRHEDLSGGQEWLWEACVSELAYRRRSTSTAWPTCSCDLCFDTTWEELELPY